MDKRVNKPTTDPEGGLSPDPASLQSKAMPLQIEPRWFEPWRCARTARGQALVADVIKCLDGTERARNSRKRRRKEDDAATFRATVEAVVADLAHLHLSQSADSPKLRADFRPTQIVVPRSNRILACGPRRYRPPAYSSRLPAILDAMAEGGFLAQEIGDQSQWPRVFIKGEFGATRDRKLSTIWPGQSLMWRIEDHGVTLDDFTIDNNEELILLKGHKPKRGEVDPPHIEPRAPLIDYDDTATTRRLREEMRAINAWLAGADLSLVEKFPGELAHVDLSARTLKRHFTRGRFDSGGRLFGGFWLTLPKVIRRERLRIDDEPTVTADYSSMFVSLAYARAGARGRTSARPKMPKTGGYLVPGLEDYEKGTRKLIQAWLFSDGPLLRVPHDTRPLLPPRSSVEELMSRIAAHHRPIADRFGTRTGHGVMFLESCILVEVLRRLRGQGIVGLPLHDAVCVARSKGKTTKRIMKTVFQEMTGSTCEVKVS